MKRFIVLGTLMFVILSGCSSKETLTTDEKVTVLVNSYLEALESKNLLVMVKYTDDLRFPNKKEQMEAYKNINDEITETRIVNIKNVNESEFEATVEIVDNGEKKELTFPIQKQEKDWRIIVGQSRK